MIKLMEWYDLNNNIIYNAKCKSCKCHFQFNNKDMELGEFWKYGKKIQCPNCGEWKFFTWWKLKRMYARQYDLK